VVQFLPVAILIDVPSDNHILFATIVRGDYRHQVAENELC